LEHPESAQKDTNVAWAQLGLARGENKGHCVAQSLKTRFPHAWEIPA